MLVVRNTKEFGVAVHNFGIFEMLQNNTFRRYNKLAHEIQQEGHAEQLTVVPTVLSATGVVPQTMHASETFKPDRRELKNFQSAAKFVTCNAIGIYILG